MSELLRLSDDLVVINSIGDLTLLDDSELPDDFPVASSPLAVLREYINDCGLTARELTAMKMRLGMDGYPPMSRGEIAVAMGASVARIRQIECKLIRRSPLRCYRPRRKLLDAID